MTDQYIMYYIIKLFQKQEIDVDKTMKEQFSKMKTKVEELGKGDKYHYMEYAEGLFKLLNKKYDVKKIAFDSKNQTKKHMVLNTKKDNIMISFDRNRFCRSVIPSKLPKICGYNRNSNLWKTFESKYDDICDKFVETYNDEVFSQISKNKMFTQLYLPINKLVVKTFNRKRRNAKELYQFIINDELKVIFVNATHKKYQVFELNLDINQDDEPNGIYVKLDPNDPASIIMHFNNNLEFKLELQYNAHKVSEKVALKYIVSLDNVDKYLIPLAKKTL